jgi:hypothetical protein
MGDYFECEVKRNNEEETSIGKVYLRLLPRIGEFMRITFDSNIYNCRVTDIAHFVGGEMVGHRVQIYVDWA